jgi:hypothetical protein
MMQNYKIITIIIAPKNKPSTYASQRALKVDKLISFNILSILSL